MEGLARVCLENNILRSSKHFCWKWNVFNNWSTLKAELLSQIFSTLDDSGMFLLLIPPLTLLCLLLKVFNIYDLSGLNLQKAYGPCGVPFIILRICASMLTLCLIKLSISAYQHLSFLPLGSTLTHILLLRRITAPTPQTKDYNFTFLLF